MLVYIHCNIILLFINQLVVRFFIRYFYKIRKVCVVPVTGLRIRVEAYGYKIPKKSAMGSCALGRERLVDQALLTGTP